MFEVSFERKPKKVSELQPEALFVHVHNEVETLVRVANFPSPTTARGHEMQVTVLKVGQNGDPKGILFGFTSKGYRNVQESIETIEILWSYDNYLRYPRTGILKWLFGV